MVDELTKAARRAVGLFSDFHSAVFEDEGDGDGLEVIFDRKDRLRRLCIKVAADGVAEAVRIDEALEVVHHPVVRSDDIVLQLLWLASNNPA